MKNPIQQNVVDLLSDNALFLTWKAENNIITRLSCNRLELKRITDAFLFAKNGHILEGTLPISGFDRLHDLLAEVSGEIAYRIEGAMGGQSEALLQLRVTGVLHLVCQRCLGAVFFNLDVDNLLELVPQGVELSQEELEDDTRDFLPVARELSVVEFVEDEILLSLPVAPRHENCSLPGAADAGERINPFATLAGLKGKPN